MCFRKLVVKRNFFLVGQCDYNFSGQKEDGQDIKSLGSEPSNQDPKGRRWLIWNLQFGIHANAMYFLFTLIDPASYSTYFDHLNFTQFLSLFKRMNRKFWRYQTNRYYQILGDFKWYREMHQLVLRKPRIASCRRGIL